MHIIKQLFLNLHRFKDLAKEAYHYLTPNLEMYVCIMAVPSSLHFFFLNYF